MSIRLLSKSKVFWFWIIVIIVVSLAVTFCAPINETFRGIAVLPSVAGLAAAIFQLLRDYSSYQRNIEIQKKQQLFNLGATSHMANTVFDKHVEFCEKYLSEVHQLVVTLTKEGPKQNALDHAGKLYDLRIEYTAWITQEIEDKLMPFETAIREMGANASFIQMFSGSSEQDENRLRAVEKMYDIFKDVLEISADGPKDETVTVRVVKNKVREILGIDELVAIRDYLIQESAKVAL